MKILLTGASGLLGTELRKLGDFISPSHKEFDITNLRSMKDWFIYNNEIDLILHAAAYTDVVRAEIEKEKCYTTNVCGTENVAQFGIPVIYMSTEYIFDGEKGNYSEEDYPNPRNFYALTKLLGEFVVNSVSHIIIRTCFKPKPFEHAAACIDQFTSGDYVDIIAKEIMKIVDNYSLFRNSIINIGTEKKSIYELARQTRDVLPISINDITVKLPKDTTLNLEKWRNYECRFCTN